MRFLLWIILALAGIMGLPNMGRADDCRLRIEVRPQNVSTSVERTEVYLFIQDGFDVELLETQPRVFVGDWRKFEITVEHFDRGEGATIGLTFLVFDESGTQVQSNGMTEISVGSLECNNSWRQLRVRISARKANALMMRHLDGFESLDLVLNDGQYLPARISYLTEIIGLDLDFDDREHDRFEALISGMFQSFEKLSDENKDWVLRELDDIFLWSENSESALSASLLAGYIDFLTSAMSSQNRTFLVRGKTAIQNYALGRLGRVMDDLPDGAVQSSAEVLQTLAAKASIAGDETPGDRAIYARQCLSMGRIALQAVQGVKQFFVRDFPNVVSIYVDTVGCLHDYYDLLEGASVYDTEEVVQRLNEDRKLGGDVASDLIRTFVCLPEDLQDILVDGDTDDKVTYVMENISSDQSKC